MTTISQVPQRTDRPTSEMLVPMYIPVHAVSYHATQSSQQLLQNLQSLPCSTGYISFKLFYISKSNKSSTECLMFISVVQYMERIAPSDSRSQYQTKSQSIAAFLLSSTKQILKLLKPTGHVMHQQFNIQQLYALPTLYICVLYLSENK